MQYVKALRTSTSLILGFTLILMLTISAACAGAAGLATTAPAVESGPVATQPSGAIAQATSVPAATAPPRMVDGVHPGKVTLMTGGFGTERFDSTYGSTGPDTARQLHGFLVGSDVQDGRMIVVPGIATGWELSDDMRTTTFTIREGVKFHDGSDVEVEDVLWTLQHYAGPEAPTYATASLSLRYGRDMEKIEQTGPDQVSVTSKLPIPEFATYCSKGAGGNSLCKVMPKREHLHDEQEALAYDKNPIAAGIIKLVDHRPGEIMTFERFEDYYHQPDNGFPNDKRINFTTMEFVLAQDESTRIAAIRAGEADMGRVSLGAASQIESGGGRLIFSPEARAFEIQFWGCFRAESRRGGPDFPCADKKVRQAMQFAIDKEKMQNELFGGPAVMEAKGWWVVTPSTIGYSPELDPYPFDPEKARQLLAEAGYPGGKGFGQFVVNTYISAYIPFMVESAQLAAEFWRTELGLDVEVRQHDRVAMSTAIKFTPRDFDGQLLWKGQDTRLDAAGITKLFFLNRDSDAAYYYHSDPELWELGDRTMTKLGQDGEHEAFRALYKRLWEEAYYIGVGYINIPWGIGPRIASWDPDPVAEYASAFDTIVLK